MGVHSVSATRRAETLGDFDNEHDEDSTEKSYKTKDRLWEDTRYTSNMNMPSREMVPKKRITVATLKSVMILPYFASGHFNKYHTETSIPTSCWNGLKPLHDTLWLFNIAMEMAHL